jgi:hypothetical protein
MNGTSGGALSWLDQLGGFVKTAGQTYADVKTTLAGTNPAIKADQTPTAPTSPIQVATTRVSQYVWLAAGAAVIIGVAAYVWRKK